MVTPFNGSYDRIFADLAGFGDKGRRLRNRFELMLEAYDQVSYENGEKDDMLQRRRLVINALRQKVRSLIKEKKSSQKEIKRLKAALDKTVEEKDTLQETNLGESSLQRLQKVYGNETDDISSQPSSTPRSVVVIDLDEDDNDNSSSAGNSAAQSILMGNGATPKANPEVVRVATIQPPNSTLMVQAGSCSQAVAAEAARLPKVYGNETDDISGQPRSTTPRSVVVIDLDDNSPSTGNSAAQSILMGNGATPKANPEVVVVATPQPPNSTLMARAGSSSQAVAAEAARLNKLMTKKRKVRSSWTVSAATAEACARSVALGLGNGHLNGSVSHRKANSYRPSTSSAPSTTGPRARPFTPDRHGVVGGSGRKRRRCLCGRTYPNIRAIKKHIAYHSGRLYPCEVCGKMFKSISNRNAHQRTHQSQTSGEVQPRHDGARPARRASANGGGQGSPQTSQIPACENVAIGPRVPPTVPSGDGNYNVDLPETSRRLRRSLRQRFLRGVQ